MLVLEKNKTSNNNNLKKEAHVAVKRLLLSSTFVHIQISCFISIHLFLKEKSATDSP